MKEIRCPDGDHLRPRHKEFQRVFRVLDPSHAKYRDLDSMCRLIYHAHSNRFDTGARHAARPVRQRKCFSSHINLHARQCVDQGNTIRPSRLDRSRHLCDIRHMRAQLHDNRLFCHRFDRLRYVFRTFRILSERDPPCLYIRAGYVDLQQIYLFIRQALDDLDITFLRTSAHIDNNAGFFFTKKWKISLNKCINTRIL